MFSLNFPLLVSSFSDIWFWISAIISKVNVLLYQLLALLVSQATVLPFFHPPTLPLKTVWVHVATCSVLGPEVGKSASALQPVVAFYWTIPALWNAFGSSVFDSMMNACRWYKFTVLGCSFNTTSDCSQIPGWWFQSSEQNERQVLQLTLQICKIWTLNIYQAPDVFSKLSLYGSFFLW